MLTLEEVKTYLRVDLKDDDNFIIFLISTSKEYLRNAVSNEIDFNDNLVKLAQLMIISHWYDNRGVTMDKTDAIINGYISILIQLRG